VQEREFLPAALEILETPPSPAGRTVVFVLALIVAVGLGWAWFGRVDITAVAPGKVVSQVHTKLIQPFETSTVNAILVSPGQKVRAGDAIIELDPTAALAERDRAKRDLSAAELDRVRLETFLDKAPTEMLPRVSSLSISFDEDEIRRAQAQLDAQRAERLSKLAAIDQERIQRKAEREALVLTLAKVEQGLPFIAERADIRAKVTAMGYASLLADSESQQLLVEAKSEMEIDRAKIESLDAAIEGLDQKAAATQAEISSAAFTELSQARERARAASEALAKANHRVELQTLRAPIDGTVQQLHVSTIGAVVTPGQQLLSIVPDEGPIEVEAVLENRDIGFVAVGQSVEIKVDAFPFTRYGLMRGVIKSVDRDAEAPPTGQGAQGSELAADGMANLEASDRLRYDVHIAVSGNSLTVDGRRAVLLPGMSVKAEILTGRRRIVDFLLAPLAEHIHDGLRER
jgi:HlyD family secretion protein/hemolysin D